MLESPTGTGKTLCLLTATLAWRNAMQAQRELQALQSPTMAFLSATLVPSASAANSMTERLQNACHGQITEIANPDLAPPLIIYASRTHSQLNQVLQELRRTAYQPKVALQGGREQLCLNEQVWRVRSLLR